MINIWSKISKRYNTSTYQISTGQSCISGKLHRLFVCSSSNRCKRI